MSKYNSKKTVIDGQKFDSKKEANLRNNYSRLVDVLVKKSQGISQGNSFKH